MPQLALNVSGRTDSRCTESLSKPACPRQGLSWCHCLAVTAGCRAVASASGQQVTGQLHNSAAMSSWSSGQQQTSSVQVAMDSAPGQQQNAGSALQSAQRHERVPLREITPAEQSGEASGAAWATLNRHAAAGARAQRASHHASFGGSSTAAGLVQWQFTRGDVPAGRQQHASLVASQPASNTDAASGIQLHDDNGTALLCWQQCW